MANKTGITPPSVVKRGVPLTADEMNRIVDMLISKIEGGKGINVRTFGNTIIVEDSDV